MNKNLDPHWALLKLMTYRGPFSDQEASLLRTYFLVDPKKALRNIKKNVIAVRAYDNLVRRGLKDCAAIIKDMRDQECLRIANALVWIDKLSRFLDEHGAGFVFTKALMHYPDMGHDLDLLLLDRSLDIDRVILGAFPGKMLKNSFVNVLAGKTGCDLEGCLSPLEVHHGRTGHLGEFQEYVPTIIKNKRAVSISGFTVSVPSVEDELIICVLQRLYSHMYFRITDVAEALKLVVSDNFDWDRTIRTAQLLGISDGLAYFIAFCISVNKKISGDPLPLDRLRDKLHIPQIEEPFFQDGVIRYPVAAVGGKIFLKKIFCDAQSGRFRSMARYSLIPAIMVPLCINKLCSLRKGGPA